MWLPDVYQGAPTPITAFMSAGVKLSVVWVFVRVLVFGIGSGAGGWWGALCALAAITMTVGNLAALVQTNVKRMLAYSSIAHAGYIMLGVLGSSLLVKSGDAVSASSALFYSVAYAVMTVGSFIAVGMAEPAHGRGAELSDLDGLSARRPMLALALSVLMFSLAGMPPTAGFFAKFYVFKAAVDSNLYWLAVLGVVNSLVSFYYYLRIMIHAYMNGPAGDSGAGGRDAPGAAVVAVCLILVLVFGLAPDLLQGAASSAISAISR
jgi:NADH-quinone oxidoreductase subunit N